MSLDFHWQKINIEGVHHEEYIHERRFLLETKLALEVMVRAVHAFDSLNFRKWLMNSCMTPI